MSARLSAEELNRYRREGIHFPTSVLTAQEVVFYRAAVEDLEERFGGRPKPSEMTQPHLHFRWAYDLATHPAVLDVVEDVLGPDIMVHSTTIFSKHPHTEDFVSWHQDGYYWELDSPLLTSAWIALTPSNSDNGCLRVMPGTHFERRLPHVDSPGTANNLLARGLEVAVEVDESHALEVQLEPGEMSLHHVNIVHGSKPNRSSGKRIGFAIRYVAPQVKQKLVHYEVVLARGRDGYGNYRIMANPPATSITEGMNAQKEFGERWRKLRFGS